MKVEKPTGADGFTAEFIRYGGPAIRTKVYGVVRQMWENASSQLDSAHVASDWPHEWRVGLVVLLWKRTGQRTDEHTPVEGDHVAFCGFEIGRSHCCISFLPEVGGMVVEQAGFRRGRAAQTTHCKWLGESSKKHFVFDRAKRFT